MGWDTWNNQGGYINVTSVPSYLMPLIPQPHREEEEMTIYDVLRHLINKTNWDGMDFDEENRRKTKALSIVDQLEELNIFGQLALNVKESV
jgi:phage-related protein